MMQIKNWQSFQSYRDRRPPWIRLHRDLLDNYEYQSMSAEARATLPMLWLLAAEDHDPVSGMIHLTSEQIAFRLRKVTKIVTKAIKEIASAGFISVDVTCYCPRCNSSVTNPLRNRYESVTPETETEAETETELDAKKTNPERRKSQPKPAYLAPPTEEEFRAYCRQKNMAHVASHIWDHYTLSNPPWHDSRGTPVISWKQKVLTNWRRYAEEARARITAEDDAPSAEDVEQLLGWRGSDDDR